MIGVVLACATAIAEPRVVLVEAPGGVALPALGTQVRLHGGEAIAIVKVAEPAAIGPRAQRLLAEHAATLVVWIEEDAAAVASERVYVVYVAGARRDRALIELVRFGAATPAAEVERTIALKVVGLLDEVLVARPVTPLGTPVARRRAGWPVWLDAGAGDRARADPATIPRG